MPAFLFPLLGLAALGAAAAFAGKQKGIQPTGATPPSPPPGLPPLPGTPTLPGVPQPAWPTMPGTPTPGAAIDTTWDDGLNQPWAAPIKDYAKSLLANSTNTTDLETYAYYCYYWGFPKAAAMLIARANTLHQQRGEPNASYPPATPLTPGQSTVPLPSPPPGAPPVVAPPTATFPPSLPVPATVPGKPLPVPSMPLPSMPPTSSFPIPSPGVYPTTRTYTAVKGDTGSSIALKFTGNAGRWTELRDANPGTAHAQYGMAFQPGRVLTLPASWPGGAGTTTMPSAPPVPGMPTMPMPTPVSFPGTSTTVAVPGATIGLPAGGWILPDGRLGYVLQSGDYSGARIASKFGKKEADVPSMVALNPGFPWTKGVPGMEILLPPHWWTGARTPTVRPLPSPPVGSVTLTPKG